MDEDPFAWLRSGSVGEVIREFEATAYAKGKAKGRAKGRAKAVLRIVDKRGIALTAEQRARILACTGIEILNGWLDAALDAKSADEIFG